MINMVEIQNTLFGQGEKELKLIPTSFSNSYYRKLLLTHYPKSKGVMGRRFCYDIFYDGRIIGVISAVSIPVTYKPVAKVIYGVDKITKDISLKYLNEIYSNNIFRLEYTEPNLASRILKLFRETLQKDIKNKYNINIKGIVTLTYGLNVKNTERTGVCYKADNWIYLGKTKGVHRVGMPFGEFKFVETEKKHVWLYVYPKKKMRGVGYGKDKKE